MMKHFVEHLRYQLVHDHDVNMTDAKKNVIITKVPDDLDKVERLKSIKIFPR